MKIDKTKKTMTLDLTKVLRNKRIDFAAMPESDKILYTLSCLGINKRSITVPKKGSNARNITSGLKLNATIDDRYKNYFLNLQGEQCAIGSHSPKTKAKYFGVEIECLIPFKSLGIDSDDYSTSSGSECGDCEGRGTLTYEHRYSGHETEGECQSCNGNGTVDNDDSDDNSELFCACKSKLAKKIQDLNIKGIDIKQDGSIDEGDDDSLWAVEITCLFRQDDMSSLKKLCDLLNDLKAQVNSSCGLHVHIDSRHLTTGQVLEIGKKFSLVMPFLGSMVPRSRRNNRYCKLSVSTLDGERYHAVNLTAFKKFKTIEVRLHSSTTSFLKISNWIETIALIIDAKKYKLAHADNNVQKLFKALKVKDSLRAYVISRIDKFKNSISEEVVCESEEEQAA